MRLRKFLIILGLWVALLPHLGFSITTENVLFSITGFLVIIASFYVAAIEDRHRHKRVIKEENLEEASQKVNSIFSQINTIKKQTLERITPQTKNREVKAKQQSNVKTVLKENTKDFFPNPLDETNDDVSFVETDDGRPRIKKAVSDVKIKTDSFDDIVS